MATKFQDKLTKIGTDATSLLASVVDSKGEPKALTEAELTAIGAMPAKKVSAKSTTEPTKGKVK